MPGPKVAAPTQPSGGQPLAQAISKGQGSAAPPTPGLLRGSDGLLRCAWSGHDPQYQAYHDQEWGRVLRGEQALFERLSLEAFQAGLSWLTILRRRAGFRLAFANFDPERVARFTADDEAELLQDRSIIRNRAKIQAVVANARAVLDLRSSGGLDEFIWSFAPPPRPRPILVVPARTPESVALAKGLKSRGFRFIGPTTAYAAMQACGLVVDHLRDCQSEA